MTGSPLWRPDPARAEATHLARFLHHVGQPDYAEPPPLVRRAARRVLGRGLGPLRRDRRAGRPWWSPPARTCRAPASSPTPASTWPRTCCTAGRATSRRSSPTTRPGGGRRLSGRELRAQVGALAAALRRLGVERRRPGGGVAPQRRPEAVVTMLAAASIGAVFSSCSPDFGTAGVLDRFGQIEPVVLVAADGYHYDGRPIDCLARLREIRAGLPSLRATVVVPVLAERARPERPGRRGDLGRASSARTAARRARRSPASPSTTPGTCSTPRGRPGRPKCIVHRAGGVLLMHLKEHQLQLRRPPGRSRPLLHDHRLDDVELAGLGARVRAPPSCCTTARPFVPGPTASSTSSTRRASACSASRPSSSTPWPRTVADPAATHGLGSLRTICSTGSPLSPEGFRYVYEHVKADVHLASISGGTDLCGCLVGGDPTGPVYAGEIQRPALGMAIDVWSDDGRSVPAGRGAGELVCTAPFPSMPLGFWDDGPLGPVGPRYRAAYFERFPGVWCQGDFASWTEHGGVVIHGRSDATLEPGRRAHRHGRHLPRRRARAGRGRGARVRPAVGRRRPHRAGRAPAARA